MLIVVAINELTGSAFIVKGGLCPIKNLLLGKVIGLFESHRAGNISLKSDPF